MGFLEAMILEADLKRAKKTECEVPTILDEDKKNCILKYFVLLSSSFSFILDKYFAIHPDLFSLLIHLDLILYLSIEYWQMQSFSSDTESEAIQYSNHRSENINKQTDHNRKWQIY